ncbi:MAG: NYN domain-containing protein [Gemmataceae bacterium]
MMYLIDGYNLLYAIGWMPSGGRSVKLHWSRQRLLQLLERAHGDGVSQVTVVFDASHPPPRSVEQLSYHGIDVRFAVREDEADDLIEALIHAHPQPRQLTVVSSDHRIQQAARRRECLVLTSTAYLDRLLDSHRRQQPPSQKENGKPEELSTAEIDHWLHEFADLADDPDMKELLEPFDFGEEG